MRAPLAIFACRAVNSQRNLNQGNRLLLLLEVQPIQEVLRLCELIAGI